MQYVVEGGIARFGTDLVLTLTPAQYEPRLRKLERVTDAKGEPVTITEGETIVAAQFRPTEQVEFKIGEELGVECAPTKLPGLLGAFLKPKGSALSAAQIKSRKPSSTRRKTAAKKASK